MSTELPFWEGQIDALANTLWWTFDEKFGRMAHHSPSEDEPVLELLKGHVERVCLSVPWRVGIAFCIPYIARLAMDVRDPWDQAWKCVLFVLVWPWIHHAFIYTKFLDPLRHLPGPKVFATRNELSLGTLAIWLRLGSSQRRCIPRRSPVDMSIARRLPIPVRKHPPPSNKPIHLHIPRLSASHPRFPQCRILLHKFPQLR